MGLLPDTRAVHAPVMPGTFSSPPRVSDPDMHYVAHVPWCMPWSLTGGFLCSRPRGGGGGGAFPAHAQLAILRIFKRPVADDNSWDYVDEHNTNVQIRLIDARDAIYSV